MTLDFKKLILNNVKKEMKVQHFESNCQIFKKQELPVSVQQKIAALKGESFLADGDYTLWFSGNNITKEIVEKTIFKIMNKACGSSANDSNENEFTMIDLGSGSGDAEAPTETPDDVPSMTSPAADDANSGAIGELVGTDDGEDQDEDADEADDLDESVESPAAGEKFVFIKITMK